MPCVTPSPAVTPFLKWAGGKTQLLPSLDSYFPAEIESYAEPFLGSGAVFFHLRSRGALTGDVVLADSNAELINAYQMVRDHVDELLCLLSAHKSAHGREHYYRVRAEPFEAGPAGAARTIYLNKTCFNGLYRVNSRGQFNVPLGDYKNPGIYDEATLRAAAQALRGVRLLSQDFRATIDETNSGYLYADPPYVPLSTTANFTGYVAGGFGESDQEDLAAALGRAAERGVFFVLSNSFTPRVERLYQAFHLGCVPARRAINSNPNRRGPVGEAIVSNYKLITGRSVPAAKAGMK